MSEPVSLPYKLPDYVEVALNELQVNDQDRGPFERDAAEAAILLYASERAEASVAREDAARCSPMPADELALEPPSVVALSTLADEAVAHGWVVPAAALYAAARDLSSAYCNLKTGSEALAGLNVRPSNIRWGREAAEALRSLIVERLR